MKFLTTGIVSAVVGGVIATAAVFAGGAALSKDSVEESPQAASQSTDAVLGKVEYGKR